MCYENILEKVFYGGLECGDISFGGVSIEYTVMRVWIRVLNIEMKIK